MRRRSTDPRVGRFLCGASGLASVLCACGASGPLPPSDPGATASKPPACQVIPVQHETEETYRQAAGDLQAKFFTAVAVGGSLSSQQKESVDRTLQVIPDKNQACAMLNATLLCLASGGHEDLAWALCKSVASSCSPGLSPDEACKGPPQGSTSTQTANGSGNVQVNGNSNVISTGNK